MLHVGTTKEGMMYRVTAIAFALFSSAAGAAPVYLHCQFDPALDENHRAPMDVTLNESESTVTWAFANNEHVFSGKAAFLADSVAFGSSTIRNDTIGGFTIDRTNLTLHERKMDIPNTPITAETEFTYRFVPVGKCAVVQVKRAF
jgi:hypothetical protein